MSKKISPSEAKLIRSQLKTIITFATNLEARMGAFLDGVGAVQEKQKQNQKKSVSETELKFHKSLKIKE
ncbi:MAG: hypothetical protein QM564_03105 [Bergeyella sp.]